MKPSTRTRQDFSSTVAHFAGLQILFDMLPRVPLRSTLGFMLSPRFAGSTLSEFEGEGIEHAEQTN
jgi:hypothetical protein